LGKYDFTLMSDSLGEVSLEDFRGKNVVVYFIQKIIRQAEQLRQPDLGI
jgi:hypothetical protein